MPHHVCLLTERHRRALLRHFLELGPEDRRLRFGTPLPARGVRTYVDRIDFVESDVLAVFDDRLRIVGALHIAYGGDEAEMGLSVLEAFRGQGIGHALFRRGTARLANRFVRIVHMHCLRENASVMHLARNNGMRIVVDGSEADACLHLPAPTPGTVAAEWVAERLAFLDYRGKLEADSARRLLRLLG
jgi:GNAT superfamily N-acetyltransferase